MESDEDLRAKAARNRRLTWASLGALLVGVALAVVPFALGPTHCRSNASSGTTCRLEPASVWSSVALAGFATIIVAAIPLLLFGSREAAAAGELRKRFRQREAAVDHRQELLHPRSFAGPFEWLPGRPGRKLVRRVTLLSGGVCWIPVVELVLLAAWGSSDPRHAALQSLGFLGVPYLFPVALVMSVLLVPLGLEQLVFPNAVGLSPGGVRVRYRLWTSDIGWDEISGVGMVPKLGVFSLRAVPGRKRPWLARDFFATEEQAKAIVCYPSGRQWDLTSELPPRLLPAPLGQS